MGKPMIPSAAHKHLFYTEMAKLLGAGLDIRKAAALLRDTQLPAGQAMMLKDLDRGLEAGQSITAAFGKDTLAISELERGIIGAGERGGRLAPAFEHLASYFGMLAAIRREMIRALIYPLVVLHLGIFVATVPMGLMRGNQSLLRVLGTFALALFAAYLVGGVIFLIADALVKIAPRHARLDYWLNRIPWIGKARRNLAMARFCKVYHACLLAALPMNETVRVAAEASHSGVIRAAGARLLESVNCGNLLGPRFMEEQAFPESFARSYSTGEEAGTLDTDLARWSKWFQDEAESSAVLAGKMAPKVLYFFILLFVAWKIVAFFNGYYTGILEQLDQ